MKKYRLLISISLLIICLALKGHPQPQWVGFTGSQPSKPVIELNQSNGRQIQFDVRIPGMYQEKMTQNGISYLRLSLPGGQKYGEIGNPELPAIGKLLAIPECSGMNITISFTDSIILTGYNIYPVPTIVLDTSGGSSTMKENFVKNDSVYALDQSFPTVSSKSEDGGYLRSQKIFKMSVFPVKYNPTTQRLVIYTRFEVAINFTNPQTEINVPNGYFSQLSKNTLLNYTLDQAIPPTPPGGNPNPGTVTWKTINTPSEADNIVADYLIITDDQFFNPQHSASLMALANHRAQYNGFDVVIVSVQNILNLNFAYDPL